MKLKKIGLHLFKKLVKYSVHLFVYSYYSVPHWAVHFYHPLFIC